MICLPASINNNLPGSELSIGSDSALNNIVSAVDKIKTSAVASQRCFVVEVMGRRCGYLALLSGLATGAERVYMHEDGVTLADLQRDLQMLIAGFRNGKRLGLLIRNEDANPFYTTAFMCALFEQEGGELFDVRQAILGHLQQGGDPSPSTASSPPAWRRRASSTSSRGRAGTSGAAAFIGIREGKLTLTPSTRCRDSWTWRTTAPKEQWWRALAPIAQLLAAPGPQAS